jgi:hypothetical protein
VIVGSFRCTVVTPESTPPAVVRACAEFEPGNIACRLARRIGDNLGSYRAAVDVLPVRAGHRRFLDDEVARLKQIDRSGPLPDRYVQSNYEAMNALKRPQGDKTLRKEDHQAFLREFIFDIKDGKHRIIEVVPKEKTIVPPSCKFVST